MGGLSDLVSFEPIAGHPALLLEGERPAIVIADLHLGYGEELEEKGILLGKQSEEMLSELGGLSALADRLIILGDLKHTIGYRKKRSDLPSFMASLLTYYDNLDVVPGNHDSLIARSLPQRVRLHGTEGFAENGVSFCHGHAWPGKELMSSELLLMGHLHPAVRFVDSLGHVYVEKCWLRVPFKKRDPAHKYASLPREMVVLPAFNPLLTGTPVNLKDGKRLGPVFREKLITLSKGALYLLDGTHIGTVAGNLA